MYALQYNASDLPGFKIRLNGFEIDFLDDNSRIPKAPLMGFKITIYRRKTYVEGMFD